jgi:hypothetical protein
MIKVTEPITLKLAATRMKFGEIFTFIEPLPKGIKSKSIIKYNIKPLFWLKENMTDWITRAEFTKYADCKGFILSQMATHPSQQSEEKSPEIMTLGSALLNNRIQPKDEFITTGLWNYQMSTDHRLFITNAPEADPYLEFLPLTKENLNIEGYVRPHPDNQKVFEPQRSKKFNLYDFLVKHREWSRATFGPGKRTEGAINHLKKGDKRDSEQSI